MGARLLGDSCIVRALQRCFYWPVYWPRNHGLCIPLLRIRIGLSVGDSMNQKILVDPGQPRQKPEILRLVSHVSLGQSALSPSTDGAKSLGHTDTTSTRQWESYDPAVSFSECGFLARTASGV